MSRDSQLFLEDVETACRKIVRYTKDRQRDAVFSDERRFDAVLYNLHIIGEAVKTFPRTFANGTTTYRGER